MYHTCFALSAFFETSRANAPHYALQRFSETFCATAFFLFLKQKNVLWHWVVHRCGRRIGNVLPFFAARSNSAQVLQHCAVFEAHTLLVEEVLRASKYAARASKLRQAVGVILASYKNLFGPDTMTPKFHYLHHLPDFVEVWGQIALPSCWVLERKHKQTKRFANAMSIGAAASTRSWDMHVLRGVTEQHLWTLDDPGLFVSEGLLAPR